MIKFYCDRCGKEMPMPIPSTDNSCAYFKFDRANDIEIHLAYRTAPGVAPHVCPECIMTILNEELGITPPRKRRIE